MEDFPVVFQTVPGIQTYSSNCYYSTLGPMKKLHENGKRLS